MPFSARNARYLRISTHTVLPLYIYLDDKHTEWMTDYTLQRVLEDLRPVIGPKLKAENNLPVSGGLSAKKGTVDVHRGDTYQFAYFFRKNEPHAVLIKSRNFVPSQAVSVAQTSETPVVEPPQSSKQNSQKRGQSKVTSVKPTPGTCAKSKKPGRISSSGEGKEALRDAAGGKGTDALQGSTRRTPGNQTLMAEGYREMDGNGDNAMMVDTDHDSTDVDQDIQRGNTRDTSRTTAQIVLQDAMVPDPEARLSPLNVDTEGEEEKPKLSMKVTYQGFTIYDRCLCVIIEPWPTLWGRSRARSVAPSLPRHPDNSTALREQAPVMSIRERTPLFLPELDSRRSSTPAPMPSKFFPPPPLFEDNTRPEDEVDAVEEGGMMAFSQILKSVGGERAGSADEDEIDVFLGDADERKGER